MTNREWWTPDLWFLADSRVLHPWPSRRGVSVLHCGRDSMGEVNRMTDDAFFALTIAIIWAYAISWTVLYSIWGIRL